MTVSVILPVHNERDNIQPLIAEIQRILHPQSHQIIVVDDQSSDGTETVLRGLSEDGTVVIHTDARLGLARSIEAGIARAEGEFIVVMDSDFNHQPAYLPFMIGAMDVYDAAFASRFFPGGGMESWWRHCLSRWFNLFIQILLNSPVKDHLYGFYIVRRSVLERLPFDEIFWGYGDYCMRLIYFLRTHTDRILQFPAVNGERRYGAGNTALGRTFCDYTRAVFRFAVRVRHLSAEAES